MSKKQHLLNMWCQQKGDYGIINERGYIKLRGLAARIYEFLEEQGAHTCYVTVTQRYLAEVLNVTPQQVSKVFRALVRNDVLDFKPAQWPRYAYKIVDPTPADDRQELTEIFMTNGAFAPLKV